MKSSQFKKGTFVIVPNKDVALKLRGAALNVYMALCAHADDEGKCFPSYQTLAEMTGYSERFCKEAMGTLVSTGLIERDERQRKDGSQTSNEYQLLLLDSSPGGEPDSTGGGGVHSTPYITQPIGTQPLTKLDKSNLGERDKRDPSVQLVIEHFEHEMGIQQPALSRRYAQLLVKKYGLDSVKAMVSAAARAQAVDKFCPRTPTLEKFWFQKEKLQDYFRRKTDTKAATTTDIEF